jgi:hypothetical protein
MIMGEDQKDNSSAAGAAPRTHGQSTPAATVDAQHALSEGAQRRQRIIDDCAGKLATTVTVLAEALGDALTDLDMLGAAIDQGDLTNELLSRVQFIKKDIRAAITKAGG